MIYIMILNLNHDTRHLYACDYLCSSRAAVLRRFFMMGRRRAGRITLTALLPLLLAAAAAAQSTDSGGALPSFGSVTTPRPINPATGTTNPSARATQTLNPYLGSTSDDKVVDGEIKLTLTDAVSRGLRFNLGLIDSEQADASVRAERTRIFRTPAPDFGSRAAEL
jgi:hypothetical protein